MHFSLMRLFELLFFRLWSPLFFPINWSVAPQIWLSTACLLFLSAATTAMPLSKPNRRMTLASIVFAIVAILPASHLALLDAALLGSRVFHLAIIGLSLLIGALYEGFAEKRAAALVMSGFLVFQCVALVHNLLIWKETADLAQRTCMAFARMAPEGRPGVVLSLPRQRNGVFFLSNGFPNCVYVNSGKQPAIVTSSAGEHGESVFTWDEKSKSMRPVLLNPRQ